MSDDNFMMLFNSNDNQNDLYVALSEKVSFDLSVTSVFESITERNRILTNKGLVDLSMGNFIKASDILAETKKMTEKKWLKELPNFLEIFYELRQMNLASIEDEAIIELIGKKYHYYDEDFNKVAAYFETNFDLEEELL